MATTCSSRPTTPRSRQANSPLIRGMTPSAPSGRWLGLRSEGEPLFPPLIDQRGDQAGPARLVRRAEPFAGVGVEELVEQEQISPVRVALEFLHPAVHGAKAVAVAGKDADQ